MTWKCIVCETINRDRLVTCEVCDAVKPGIDPAQVTKAEIACVKVELHSSPRSIEEYIYESRSWARTVEKRLLKASAYAKWFAFILIPLLLFLFIKVFLYHAINQ